MRLSSIRPIFVEFIPKELEDGVLYISERFNTASHKCACGWCGERVVTPLSPVEWQLHRDGDLVSLHPSIGNWNFPCHSHYWIRRNKIYWAATLSENEIRRIQRKDLADKKNYVEAINRLKESEVNKAAAHKSAPAQDDGGHVSRFLRWLQNLLAGPRI